MIPAELRNRPQPVNYVLSELTAIWSDIYNAIQGFKSYSTKQIVINKVLGLEAIENRSEQRSRAGSTSGENIVVQTGGL